jgi:predicted secreted Zn-dependent protease
VDVSRPKRFEIWLLVIVAAAALAFACGGGSETPPSSSGADTETDSQLSPGKDEPVVGGIELDTSLDTEYYEVEGTTTESIFNNIEQNGPTDGDGKRGSGLTSVVWGYEWQGGPEGGECAIRSMTIKADMVVTLPQHLNADSLPAGIADDWNAYTESVATHEQTHVDIYEEGAKTIRERMLAIGSMSTCDELETEIKRIWAEEQARINNQQAEFHQQEFDRLAQRRAPISAKIDANRTEINSLRDPINALDDQIENLRAQIDELILEINDIDQEITAINDSNQSAADKKQKLDVLIQQRNALQQRHNDAVDSHNAALVKRESLVSQRNALIDETNKLVDEFNWTR